MTDGTALTRAPRAMWDEAAIKSLIGQSESMRREYKSGAIITNSENWKDALAKSVSAFANSEGGTLFLGVAEGGRRRPRVAEELDGVDDSLTNQRSQQIIEGNLSPYLPGIRVHRIRLSSLPQKSVYLIEVPKGATAYQANDNRYYGRSEFESKALPDHEVRLRMNRGRIARANVVLRQSLIARGEKCQAAVKAKYPEAMDAFRTDPACALSDRPELSDLIGVGLLGDELRGLAVLTEESHAHEFQGFNPHSSRYEMPWRSDLFWRIPGNSTFRAIIRDKRGNTFSVWPIHLSMACLLDDSPPSEGEIDVGEEIERARGNTSKDQSGTNPPSTAMA